MVAQLLGLLPVQAFHLSTDQPVELQTLFLRLMELEELEELQGLHMGQVVVQVTELQETPMEFQAVIVRNQVVLQCNNHQHQGSTLVIKY